MLNILLVDASEELRPLSATLEEAGFVVANSMARRLRGSLRLRFAGGSGDDMPHGL